MIMKPLKIAVLFRIDFSDDPSSSKGAACSLNLIFYTMPFMPVCQFRTKERSDLKMVIDSFILKVVDKVWVSNDFIKILVVIKETMIAEADYGRHL